MATGKNFFISYTGADVAWAQWIAQTLEDAGYDTVLQAWDFRPGRDFVHLMHQGIQDAAHIIAVLSPAYLNSAFGEAEWRAVFALDPTGERGLLLPVRIAEVTPQGLLRSRIYVDLVGVDEHAASARLLDAVQYGRAKPADRVEFPGVKRGMTFPGRRPAIFEVPPRNRHFTGRDDLLETLRTRLADTSTGAVVQGGAVHGLGGVGKTQLAVEYAHRYAVDYDLVWWVPAEQPPTISGRLAQLGRRLGLPELPSLEEQVGIVFDALGQKDRWLLIYDNAQQPSDIDGLRPPAGGGQVLITSRNPVWGGVAATIQVNSLPREHATAFLVQRIGTENQMTLGRLAAALGDLPLALEQAAAYLEETNTTPGEYVELLHDRSRELFALGRPATTEQTVATTWTVALDRLKVEAPAAEDLLCLCAFLAPDDFPHALLTEHTDGLPERLAGAVGDRLAFQQVSKALRRYSLATVTTEALSVHRLVQAVIRSRMDQTLKRRWSEVAVDLLCKQFPDASWDPATWPTCHQLLVHVLGAVGHARELGLAHRQSGWLLDRASRFLRAQGQYREARPLAEQALAITQEAFGQDHPDLSARHDALGTVLWQLGDLVGAHTQFELAVQVGDASLRSDNRPDTADLASWHGNLGTVLADLGDLEDARDQYELTLLIGEASLGADHPAVASWHGNLGTVLADLGDLEGARAEHVLALQISEASLGADHPAMATRHSNLGTVLWRLGDLEAARAEHELALQIGKTALGPDHPAMASWHGNLGTVLADLGNLEARTHYERAHAIFHRAFGKDDSRTQAAAQALRNH